MMIRLMENSIEFNKGLGKIIKCYNNCIRMLLFVIKEEKENQLFYIKKGSWSDV